MNLDRRAFLGACAAAAFFQAPVSSGFAAARPAKERGLWLSARGDGAGRYFATGFGADGSFAFDLPLPTRGHSFAVHPRRTEAVAFGRRPGEYALTIDLAEGRALRTVPAAAGRHFNGHGIFAADGSRLFATETAIETGNGIVGIYDPQDGYRRVGEFASRGLDPHDVRLLPDGRTLVVANGGLMTHPDAPGMKLNIATMQPSLDYFDARDGSPLTSARLPETLHQLSIRHLAVGHDGTVAVALQYEGPSADLVPLVCLHRPGAAALEPIGLPDTVLRDLRNYCGSAAVDAEGKVLAVSSPRGGISVFWDLDTGRPAGTVKVADGCGLAPTGTPGMFLLSSGMGGIGRYAPAVGTLNRLENAAADDARWDNHIVAVV